MLSMAMITFSAIYIIYKYYKDPKSFDTADLKSDKNIFGLTSNPFKNAILPPVILLSIVSIIRFATQYLSFTILPISVSLPMTALTTFSVILFAYLLRGQEITINQKIAAALVTIGIIIINMNKILSNTNEARSIKNSHYIFGVIILLLAILLNGYLLTIDHVFS